MQAYVAMSGYVSGVFAVNNGVQINIKTTEYRYQPQKFLSDVSLPTTVFINKELLLQCKSFNYLGSTVAENARLDKELSLRIRHAIAVY